jgi:predicted dehydrogenase
MEALEAGKHVVVEKPLATSVEEGEALVEAADRRGLVLMVDHTFVYSGAVEKIREIIDEGRLGELYYYDSVRVNLGMFQRDVNVLWDLAVHDLAIMDYVLGKQAVAVAAVAAAHIPDSPQNTAYLTCFFEDELLAHLHVNWLSPVKIRRTLIGGADRMILYDDMEPDEKVKVYDKGVIRSEDAGDLRVGYRAGDMWAPRLSVAEALRTEAEHFLECITQGAVPRSDGRAGLQVLQILEAATRSLGLQGRPVEIERLRGTP